MFVDEPACGEHVTAQELAALDDGGDGDGGVGTTNVEGYTRPRYYSFGILSRHMKQLELVYNRTAQLNNSLSDRPASSQQYGDTLDVAISQLERKIAGTLVLLSTLQEKVLLKQKFLGLEAETERYKSLRRSTSRFIKNGCTHEEQPPESALKLGLNIPFTFIGC